MFLFTFILKLIAIQQFIGWLRASNIILSNCYWNIKKWRCSNNSILDGINEKIEEFCQWLIDTRHLNKNDMFRCFILNVLVYRYLILARIRHRSYLTRKRKE